MKNLGLVVAGAAGLAVSLLGGQAFAAPTCSPLGSITVGNGEIVPDALLDVPGVCVIAADKTYGNFAFGNLPSIPILGIPTGDVLFDWTLPVGTGHSSFNTEEFIGALPSSATTTTTYTGFGFEVEVNSTGAGNVISELTGDFDQTNPLAGTSTLVKDVTTNGGVLTCTRDPTTCPASIPEDATRSHHYRDLDTRHQRRHSRGYQRPGSDAHTRAGLSSAARLRPPRLWGDSPPPQERISHPTEFFTNRRPRAPGDLCGITSPVDRAAFCATAESIRDAGGGKGTGGARSKSSFKAMT